MIKLFEGIKLILGWLVTLFSEVKLLVSMILTILTSALKIIFDKLIDDISSDQFILYLFPIAIELFIFILEMDALYSLVQFHFADCVARLRFFGD